MTTRTDDSEAAGAEDVHRRDFGLVWARLGWGLWVPNWFFYLRATLRLTDADDWHREASPIPPGWFTRPHAPLSRYLYDRSTVEIEGVGDIHFWLRECEYQEELDDQPPGAWIPPSAFESTRRGTCTEHAVWAWRKLRELDCEAELVVGALDDGEEGLHAWVQLDPGRGSPTVFETTSKATAPNLLDLESADAEGYRPWYSVDTRMQTYLYPGHGDARVERYRGHHESR